jgi:hypothetical protein
MIKHPFVYACDLGHALVESYCSHLVAQVVLIRMAPFFDFYCTAPSSNEKSLRGTAGS